ncbi:hypothetical protein DPMN_096747 [Dreissena polymorpha]|uniref:Uncharacterized protein n=1 Tax=Dreissena polymorpha TaxID=45954 RepID=A0A9D4LAC8_DREPO|nr:hypothetical protein DPMN_096747 [Dreissena polymorpha]
MADVEEPKAPSNGKKVSKGKAPAVQRTHTDVPKVNMAESVNNDLNNKLVMECLKSIQETQSSMVQRIMALEQGQASFFEEEGDFYTPGNLICCVNKVLNIGQIPASSNLNSHILINPEY